MIASEIEKIKPIYQDTNALKDFWENRYTETYHDLLESRNEIGRHGVIAEYITKIIRKGTVLDIGCGTGILAELLDLDLFQYTGLDIAREAIALARGKQPGLKNRFHNIRFEEYQSEKPFDVIVANEILYYVDAGIFFKQCNRLLAPRGHLIVSVFDFKKGKTLLPVIKARLATPFEISVSNPEADLKWEVIAGEFKIDIR